MAQLIQNQYDLGQIEVLRSDDCQVVMGFDQETKRSVVCIVVHKGNRIFQMPLRAEEARDLGTLLLTGADALTNFEAVQRES